MKTFILISMLAGLPTTVLASATAVAPYGRNRTAAVVMHRDWNHGGNWGNGSHWGHGDGPAPSRGATTTTGIR